MLREAMTAAPDVIPPERLAPWTRGLLRRVARQAVGHDILDIGYYQRANPYLRGRIIGSDLFTGPVPEGYEAVVQADMRDLRSRFEPASFDTVILGFCIGYAEAPVSVIADAATLVKPHGRLILSWSNPLGLTKLARHLLGRYRKTHWITDPAPNEMVSHFLRAGLIEVRVSRGIGLVVPWWNTREWPMFTRFGNMLIYTGTKPAPATPPRD
jgi:SAM-dependent methyltransferase